MKLGLKSLKFGGLFGRFEDTKIFSEINWHLKQRKVTIISISIAIFIATVVTIAIIIHIYSSPCKNNGFYFQERGIYKCNCNGTKFTGDQCEVAIVEEVMNRDNFTIISEIKTWWKYRVSEWAAYQVWKFLHIQKLAHCTGRKACFPRTVSTQKARFFFPRANFKVKFPYLKPIALSEIVFL